MSMYPTRGLCEQLDELLGISLHLNIGEAPRLVLRGLAADGEPRTLVRRLSLDAQALAEAPAPDAPLDLEALAAAARARVQLCIDQLASKHLEALKLASVRAHCRMWTALDDYRGTPQKASARPGRGAQ